MIIFVEGKILYLNKNLAKINSCFFKGNIYKGVFKTKLLFFIKTHFQKKIINIFFYLYLNLMKLKVK